MKKAIVDMGSNSVRLSVYDIREDGGFDHLFSEKIMAGLVNYVVDGHMNDDGIKTAVHALEDFKDLLHMFGIEKMQVFATASLRNIKNSAEARSEIERRSACEIDLISGEEEALFSYTGALHSTHLTEGAIFDIGGGSTELVSVSGGKIEKVKSVGIGSLSLFKSHVDDIWPDASEISDMCEHIDKVLSKATLSTVSAKKICGVGGTARALLKMANVLYNRDRDSRELSAEQLREIVAVLKKRNKETKKLILSSCPDRLHTVIPGALLTERLCRLIGGKELVISKYGVREGYLCQKVMASTI